MKSLTLIAAGMLALTAPALAQQTPAAPSTGQAAPSAMNLPEACRSAVQASAQGDMMQKMQDMHGNMSQTMQGNMQGMMGQMTETQKGLHEAMMKMNGPMMMGMMAKDADVAWICSMIPHHQGAIDMARAGLKGADNEESKKLAEETIQSNEREIKKLVAWVEKNAQKESKDEATGSTK
jgi:uncharacterized protein (DUF305 family)